jgi:hypothetical protein
MTENPTYPTLTDAALVPFRALEVQLDKFPDLFDRPDCPYPPHIRTVVQRLCGVTAEAPTAYDDESLESEIVSLYNELKRVGLNVTGVDAKEKIALLKTSGDLLTKMVQLRERQINVREMGAFQRLVIQFMEESMTPAQRNEFIEKMGKYLDVR